MTIECFVCPSARRSMTAGLGGHGIVRNLHALVYPEGQGCRRCASRAARVTEATDIGGADNGSADAAGRAGGRCFWGMQDLILRLPGVTATRVGYTGGDVANATYRNHGTHAEAIEILFDPEQTGFREILEFFFQIHDPNTRNHQGNDIGLSYRSPIYYDEQKRIAEDTVADVNPDCGRARSSPRSSRWAPSGRPSLSTRTIWSATPRATPATSRARDGGFPPARRADRLTTATVAGGHRDGDPR